jgi:hypothetical protein
MLNTDNLFAIIGQRLDIIDARQNEILRILAKQPASQLNMVDDPVSTEKAAKMFGIAKQTIYQNIRKIPHTKRFGRLYFYPSQLRAYLENGTEVAHD